MARKLGDAVNQLNGQIQLSRIDIASNPSIAQAFQEQGAPALFALIGGRPMPILQGLPSDEELQQITEVVVPKLIAAAQQAGVTGSAPYSGDPDSDAANSASAASAQDQIPPEHQEAYMLAQQGDYAGAAAAYGKVLESDPNDSRAARERAKALLLARSGSANVREVRAAAAEHPNDVDAQLAVADIDMIGGQIQDAFDRLLAPSGHAHVLIVLIATGAQWRSDRYSMRFLPNSSRNRGPCASSSRSNSDCHSEYGFAASPSLLKRG